MAKSMIDYGRDADNNYLVAGDFVRVESTAKHQKDIILNNKNDYKQNPTIGVGAFDFLNDEGMSDLIREVAKQFNQDGMDVKSVKLGAKGIITTDANYV
jgi:hypothetical protein